ncbi:formylglycine-generating enzyme family protein [Candidatus Poribacteria bacterium]
MNIMIGLLLSISSVQAQSHDRLGEMITIPAGNFIVGNDNGSWEEKPQHSVYLPTYQIGKYEVTRGEYRRFIEDDGYQNPDYWSPEGWVWKEGDVVVYAGMYGKVSYGVRENREKKRNAPDHWEPEQEWIGHGYDHPRFIQTDDHPVVGVTYFEAEAYCKWAGGRLPTEAEYEKAARWNGTRSYLWPWGDTWDPEKCNNPDDHNPAGGGYRKNQSAPVGSYPDGASPYGVMDMVGNAYEWCADWAKSYPGSSRPFDHTGKYHIVKGGCWDDIGVTAAFRSWYLSPSSAGTGPGDCDYIGFRIAK